MIRVDLDQQSDKWHNWRQGGLGSSDASAILGLSPWQSRAALMEHKVAHFGCGRVRRSEKAKSPRMLRGIREEPQVRQQYIDLTGRLIVPACGIHDTYNWMRSSFDGITALNDLVVEIKCPNNHCHDQALAGSVPSLYYPQIAHHLAVSGAKVVHYVSWSDAVRYKNEDRLKVVPITPSADYVAYVIAEEEKFWNELVRKVEELKKIRLTPPAPVV
jgi:putative phage-type endonuclease